MSKKLFPASTLRDEMNKCHETGIHRTAIIVYAASNWPAADYSEESRSYRSHSNQWGWNKALMGTQCLGSCLDGTDPNVRLDRQKWLIEGWYWEDEVIF